MFELRPLRIAEAEKVLADLCEDSATGPDMVPARIPKRAASVLALPLLLLAERILAEGRWPEPWTTHWIVPLYKKGVVFKAGNYRGIHLSTQLSKAMERLIGSLWIPRVSRDLYVGEQQFAYRSGRGSRDALAFVVLTWLEGFMRKSRFAMYLSDVSGAFDRVRAERLILKMRNKRIPEAIIEVVASWLRGRRAQVVVGGSKSGLMLLMNQVFQGTVWGPVLWNLFYEDSNAAMKKQEFVEIKFADDLNAFKEFDPGVEDAELFKAMDACQVELHRWGEANQVVFDAGKEGKRILSRSRPVGDSFTLLGIQFDCKLIMNTAIDALLSKCRWKLRSLLRCQRHYDVRAMVQLYKSRLLGYIEYRTAAIYHACETSLSQVDAIQRQFLDHFGISDEAALMEFNLAPLNTRRDIAMLGLIHRSVIGAGCPQFSRFFVVRPGPHPPGRHKRQLKEYRNGDVTDYMFPNSKPADYVMRSALGLTTVYNLLPAEIVEAKSTAAFQSRLQKLVKDECRRSRKTWETLLSPRWEMQFHPLHSLA